MNTSFINYRSFYSCYPAEFILSSSLLNIEKICTNFMSDWTNIELFINGDKILFICIANFVNASQYYCGTTSEAL
jgi:hypothetical protein